MATQVLVEDWIEDGQKLLAELRRTGLVVELAFWVRKKEDGPWSLYIAYDSVKPNSTLNAEGIVYGCLDNIPGTRLTPMELHLIHTSNPIAKDAIAARDRRPGKFLLRYQGKALGNVPVEEAYIYPRNSGGMTDVELIQTLVTMTNRANGPGIPPSVVSLRDGASVRGIITGLNLQIPGGLTINMHDQSTNAMRQIAGDDVVMIQ